MFNILLIKLILAFCSMVYELLLAQSLSAFLENTVLRYSVTIGLYLISMGGGAFLAQGRLAVRSAITLLQIETVLTLVGGGSVVLLHLLNLLGLSRLFFSLSAHLLIVLIGVLTGFELPLMMALRKKEEGKIDNLLLGVDYFGAFLGTFLFAFMFYPGLGLVPTAFLVGALNAGASLLLWAERDTVARSELNCFYRWWSLQLVFLAVMAVCLFSAGRINEFFISCYVGG
ncbi:MAG: hypothetical protein V1727_04175 [Candidatus Omnitrophota bacterium]